MKKFFGVLLIFAVLLGTFAGLAMAAENADSITVLIDGSELDFDVPPQLINGRTMVPMRAIFEALGSEVYWHYATQVIIATRGNTVIVMQIDNPVMSVNGEGIELDVPPQLIGGRTLVPARAVAESLDADVGWDSSTRTVIITVDHSRREAARIAELRELLQAGGQADIRAALSVPPYAVTPVKLTEVTFFTQEELLNMALTAPTMEQTKPSRLHPNRRMTQSEVDAWVAEFWELGLNNWELLMVAEYNRVRSTYYNLPELPICPYLVLGARLTSQLLEEGHGVHGGGAGSPNLPHSSHAVAFYGGYSERVQLFGGAPGVWRGSHTWRNNPRAAIQSWRDSPAHNRIFITPGEVTAVGFGDAGGERRTTAILVR